MSEKPKKQFRTCLRMAAAALLFYCATYPFVAAAYGAGLLSERQSDVARTIYSPIIRTLIYFLGDFD